MRISGRSLLGLELQHKEAATRSRCSCSFCREPAGPLNGTRGGDRMTGWAGLFSPLRAAGSTTWGDACKSHVQSLTSAPVPSDTVGKLITASLGRLESGHNLLICACVRLPCAGVQLFGSLVACRFFCILLLKEMVVQAQALQRRIPGPSCSLSGQRQFL